MHIYPLRSLKRKLLGIDLVHSQFCNTANSFLGKWENSQVNIILVSITLNLHPKLILPRLYIIGSIWIRLTKRIHCQWISLGGLSKREDSNKEVTKEPPVYMRDE